MKRDKRISIKDFYYFYPFKKNPIRVGTTSPQPFVKHADVTDVTMSLIYNDWMAIINDYITLLKEHLLKGKAFNIPQGMGVFQLRKYKIHRKIDWGVTTNTGIKTYFKDPNQCSIILKWYRGYKISSVKFEWHWKISMSKTFGRQLFNATLQDMYYTNSILDI